MSLEALPTHLVPSWSPLAKTKFSMVLPEVEKSLQEWGTKSVVIFGIEVGSLAASRIRSVLTEPED